MENYKKHQRDCENKLKDHKILVSMPPKYKTWMHKKLAKLEKLFEQTPESCILKRQRIQKQAEKLIAKLP